MSQCYRPGDFKKYFRENMDDLGMIFPETYFTSFSTAVATAKLMISALDTVGKGATVAEMLSVTPTIAVAAEKLTIIAGLSAAISRARSSEVLP